MFSTKKIHIVLCLFFMTLAASAAECLRPPSVPLVAHDPYFSIWSPADKLAGADTVHWTGKPNRMTSLVRIDSKGYRLMGKGEATTVPDLPQTKLEVTATRTLYTFEGDGVQLTMTFMTPALPDDIDLLSRPLTYLTWEAKSIDGKKHQVEVYFDVHPELVVNDPTQQVQSTNFNVAGLDVLGFGSLAQPVLRKKGDDLRIDWGHLYVATPSNSDNQPLWFWSHSTNHPSSWATQGTMATKATPARFTPTNAVDVQKLAARFKLFLQDEKPASRWLMVAYDDEFSIKYFKKNLRPYWRRNGDDAAALLTKAAADYESLKKRCEQFDAELMADLRKAGGEKYAQLCVLAYRQTLAGNKICADANGKPLMFPKENFSNGCIGTVDVLFPQAPFFLALSPALTKAMVVPILDYAQSPLWPYDYAPHDLGTYPHATGQVYGMGGKSTDGDRMPVEECGNMLIILAALANQEGNADLAQPYWRTLNLWADYLVKEGLHPQNQLCSADMFGHMPLNANLALKAVIGIGAFSQLCDHVGKKEDAKKYRAIAKNYAGQWLKLAGDEGHTSLAYKKPGTWSMKHNLIWDRILNTKLFPDSVGDAEVAWYLKVQKRYGLPVDNRTDTSLIDWALWSIALARKDADFQALLNPIWQYANETPSRVPLSDWFNTINGKQTGFQARPVVGGVYIKLLANKSLWKHWATRGVNVKGPWAPLAVPMPVIPVAATAETQPVAWRYTLEKPSDEWTKPGFDDSKWQSGPAGFGTRQTPGAVVRTEWKTKNIWLRREVNLAANQLKNIQIRAHCDEDGTVYFNGTLAAELPLWTSSYQEFDILPEALAALKPGRNIMAVHCQQTYGGQYIDVGIVQETATTQARKLFDYPVRDTSICLGPDGVYYLTGTTGHPGWWTTNEGVRIWKSTDLTNWIPLGLVWSLDKDGTWQKKFDEKRRALWAPELHYIKGNYWIAYCMNYRGGGTGILKSTSGKVEGPYVDVKPDGPITSEIDASLFVEDDGKVYFVWQDGKIALLKDDMTGLAGETRFLKPANFKHVGFEGAFLTKMNGRYTLVCAEFNPATGTQTYDCMIAQSDSLFGPYGDRYLAVPQGGHNMIFKDSKGRWWSTFFGNDPYAPFRERPGLVPIESGADGRIHPVSR